MSSILVIDSNGVNLGQLTMEAAEEMAEECGLDLVEVRPGVYKILDLGKLSYEASKRKQTKSKPIKEMKFKLNIGAHDYNTKIGHINKFLSTGNTVRVTIWFSGREVSRPTAGTALMEQIGWDTEEFGTASINPELLGKNMHMEISPKDRKKQMTVEPKKR